MHRVYRISFRTALCLVASFLLLFCGPLMRAQVPSGTIVGTVTDSSGAVVPNAKIRATNTGTNISTAGKTDASGNYSIPRLDVGSYSLTIEAPGFSKFIASNLRLSASMTMRVDAKLQVGQANQTVEVSAAVVPMLQADTSTVSATLVPDQVQNLPLNGRNFISLVQTTPGVNEGSPAALGSGTRPDDRRQTSALSANGQPDYISNYMIDGVDDNERQIGTIGVRPSIDAIQEVHVDTNLYAANVSRTAGAAVNIITKSGTNAFHGSAFEFVRNDIFDAKDYFNVPQSNNPLAGRKPEFRQNQFGGSIGGPIRKDKTFFFADFEDLRIVQGITSTYPVPSPCELGAVACNGVQQLGNFSDLLPSTIIYNPVTHVAYPNNVIPLTAIDPISTKYAALFPTIAACPTPTSCTYTGAQNRTQFASTFDVRVDQHFSPKDTLYARYTFNNTNTFTPGALPPVNVAGAEVQPGGNPSGLTFPGPSKERQQNIALSLTHVYSPTVLMQLTASYMRSTIASLPLNFGTNVNTAFGGPVVNVNSNSSGLGLVEMQGYGFPINVAGIFGGGGTLGDSEYIPLYQFDNVFQYAGNLIWTHGNHNFNFGLGLIRRQVTLGQSASPKGIFTFTGLLTNANEGDPSAAGGNAFAQFLTGYEDSQERALALFQSEIRTWEPSAYAQDDWRATHWLTLNLGVRYDIFTPFTEKYDRMSNFDPTNPSVVAGGQFVQANQNGCGRTDCIHTDYREVVPRIGFAASLSKNTVLRGGFGITFFPTNFFTTVELQNPPFLSDVYTPALVAQPVGYVPPRFGDSLGAPVPTSPCLAASCGAPAGSIFSIFGGEVFNYNNAYATQYSLQLQKAFAGNVLTVGYVGSEDFRLGSAFDFNAPLPPLGPGGCGVTTPITLPNPCQPYYSQLPDVANLFVASSFGRADYNGLQVEFQRRSEHGLTFDTSYVYARALSNVATGGSGGGLYGLMPTNLRYDWGNSPLDVRHRWTLTLSYQLPFGKSLTGFAGQAAKGWGVNALTIWSSGLPVTVTNDGNPQNNEGEGGDRPNVIASLSVPHPSINEWFNIAAFAKQPFGTAGNEANNQVYGPPSRRLDLSLFKDFPIREKLGLQFRVETFNLFNTPNFAAPTTSISTWGSNGVPTTAGNFGQILATNRGFPARQIQLALKLLF